MSRRTIRNGGQVTCDYPGCSATFTTYSVATMARQQAEAAGWARVPASSLLDGRGVPLGSSKTKVDVCPEHKPRPRMEGARP